MATTGKEILETTLATDYEVDIEDLVSRLDRIGPMITNLKKRGRANFTRTLLKEKLAFITNIWMDALERNTALKKAIPPMVRKQLDFFKRDYMSQAQQQFEDAQDYLTTELARFDSEEGSATTSAARHSLSAGPSDNIPYALELPKQVLPRFSGEPRNWGHFADMFNVGIIQNPRLSDVQRLQYLMNCVQGEALETIASLEIIGSNFEVAWEALKSRFANPRIVISRLLAPIGQLKPIRKGDAESMRQVTGTLKTTLRALERQNMPVKEWSALLVLLVKNQLDASLNWEWELSLTHTKEYPSFDDMCDFLRGQQEALESANTQFKKPTPPPAKARLQAHNTVAEADATNSKICPLCAQPHELLTCQSFQRLSPQQRYYFAKGSQLCIICLTSGHFASQCHSSLVCRKCNGRHHVQLHFDQHKSRQPQKDANKDKRGSANAERSNAPPPSQTIANSTAAGATSLLE